MAETVLKTSKQVPISNSLKLAGDGTQGFFTCKRCQKCGEHSFGSLMFCPNCSSSDLETVKLSSQGTLRTYTVIYTPQSGWQGNVPYILGSVELPEGPDILTEVIDLSKEEIKIGMKMKMVLRVGGKDAEGNDLIVYKWQPVK